ncbi:hypothetical protein Pcinc_003466 [Petrolisthes cinctipes]|uniref:Uncharacterized protein n=1 Tax=Petrolisthes cinctipes TaxID=88211 RepID=A0AAE1GH80_PETCI|nr:hypothetical protein Pcinc_003458 [Petrolisthes cinctipes]KAK3892673.1 hypothetical protein Pcinc_003466 [Petrolisthes cinctipes]
MAHPTVLTFILRDSWREHLSTMDSTANKVALRGRIIGMKESGATTTAIARELRVTPKTRKCDDREVGPAKTNAEEVQRIIEVQRNPLTNAVHVRDAVRLNNFKGNRATTPP